MLEILPPIELGRWLPVCLVAAALGLQNAMCTSHFGAIFRTTHVTGTVTDIGSTLGRISIIYLRKGCRRSRLSDVELAEVGVDRRRLAVLLGLWSYLAKKNTCKQYMTYIYTHLYIVCLSGRTHLQWKAIMWYHVQFIEIFDGKYTVHRCSIPAGIISKGVTWSLASVRLPGWLRAPLVGTDGHALVGMSMSRHFLEKQKATD